MKTKIIKYLLLLSLLITIIITIYNIFVPDSFGFIFDMIKSTNVIVKTLFLFYFVSTTLLFWVGFSAGWNFLRQHDMGFFACFVSGLIGMELLSLPMALLLIWQDKE